MITKEKSNHPINKKIIKLESFFILNHLMIDSLKLVLLKRLKMKKIIYKYK
jgi:hypothetical protein